MRTTEQTTIEAHVEAETRRYLAAAREHMQRAMAALRRGIDVQQVAPGGLGALLEDVRTEQAALALIVARCHDSLDAEEE